MKVFKGFAAATLVLSLTGVALAQQAGQPQGGYWIFVPDTKQKLQYVAPQQAAVRPDADGFYPIIGSYMPPQQAKGVFCDTFRQAISMQVRYQEGHSTESAISFMQKSWGGRMVCRYRYETVTPIAYAIRGDDLNQSVMLIRWRTSSGQTVYNGQYVESGN